MIPAWLRAAAAFSRAAPFPAVAALLALLGSCATEREPTMARLAREREVGAVRAERNLLEQERDVLARSNQELAAALLTARADEVRNSAELRAALTALRFEVERLQRAEQDLAAAKVRGEQVERELAGLRALEATLRDRDRLLAEAGAKVTALQAEVAATTAAATAQEAELTPRLRAAAAKLAGLQKLGVTLAGAEAAIAEALAALAPPKVPEPPAKK